MWNLQINSNSTLLYACSSKQHHNNASQMISRINSEHRSASNWHNWLPKKILYLSVAMETWS